MNMSFKIHATILLVQNVVVRWLQRNFAYFSTRLLNWFHSQIMQTNIIMVIIVMQVSTLIAGIVRNCNVIAVAKFAMRTMEWTPRTIVGKLSIGGSHAWFFEWPPVSSGHTQHFLTLFVKYRRRMCAHSIHWKPQGTSYFNFHGEMQTKRKICKSFRFLVFELYELSDELSNSQMIQ